MAFSSKQIFMPQISKKGMFKTNLYATNIQKRYGIATVGNP